MRSIFVLAVFACALGLVMCNDDDFCDETLRCDRDECCVPNENSINGEGRCVDIGDDWGDLCGPPAFCDCEYGFECVPHDPTNVRGGRSSRYRLALARSNGTCEPTQETQRRWRESDRRSNIRNRHRYDDDDDDDDDFDDDRRRRRR